MTATKTKAKGKSKSPSKLSAKRVGRDAKKRAPTYGIKSKDRLRIERHLWRLHTVGHLDKGPVRVNRTWDKGSKAAIKEFLALPGEEGGKTKVSKSLLEKIGKRANELYFVIDIKNDKAAKAIRDEYARAATYRAVNQRGELHVSYYEDLVVSVRHPYGGRKAEFKVEVLDEDDRALVSKTESVSKTGGVSVGKIFDALSDEEQESIPVEIKGTLRVSCDDPHRPGRTLVRTKKLAIQSLRNVVPIRDDGGREWLFAEAGVAGYLALKDEVNAANGKKGKLYFASTLRTWSKQMDLWKKRRTNPKKYNPANQPGTSWHETGRAIDCGIWILNISPDVAGIKRKEVDLRVVRSDAVKEKGQKFLDQLDEFREMAKKHGFTLAGKKWEVYPWNRGFDQILRTGKITSAEYNRGLKYTFRFVLDREATKKLSKRGRIKSSAGTITVSPGGGKKDVTFKIPRKRKRLPARVWPKGTSKRNARAISPRSFGPWRRARSTGIVLTGWRNTSSQRG